jgi:hypothetical protein
MVGNADRHRILWTCFYPTRISSTCPGALRRDSLTRAPHAAKAAGFFRLI